MIAYLFLVFDSLMFYPFLRLAELLDTRETPVFADSVQQEILYRRTTGYGSSLPDHV